MNGRKPTSRYLVYINKRTGSPTVHLALEDGTMFTLCGEGIDLKKGWEEIANFDPNKDCQACVKVAKHF